MKVDEPEFEYVTVAGYLVAIEQGPTSYGAMVPDLPGLYGWAGTREELIEQIALGIPFHIEGLQKDGDPVPPPTTTVETLAA